MSRRTRSTAAALAVAGLVVVGLSPVASAQALGSVGSSGSAGALGMETAPLPVPSLFGLTPVLTILICGWIVIKLPVLTWMVFLGWLAVVVAFYLVYGRRHAALNTPDDPEDFAESRGDEEDERV